jgi:CPA2 family monovalent cation:H+ antiporter-2
MGVVAAIGSREVGLSPIVGYLVLGLVLNASGLAGSSETVAILAEARRRLPAVRHRPPLLLRAYPRTGARHLRLRAGAGRVRDLGLGALAWLAGLPLLPAMLVGATLALSSTAVVARIIAEKAPAELPGRSHRDRDPGVPGCRRDLLLIIATALGTGEAMLPATGLALVKAAVAFGVAVLLARFWCGRSSISSRAAATRRCSRRWRC